MSMSRRSNGPVSPGLKTGGLIGALAAAYLAINPAQALTLGHSRIVSAPGQALHVEIPVTQLSQQELESLLAVPAPRQEWQAAGMTPPVPLDSLRLVLLDGYRPDSKVIQLRSTQPYQGSVVDLLLDIRTTAGQQRHQVSLVAHSDLAGLQRVAVSGGGSHKVIDGKGPLPAGFDDPEGRAIRVQRGDTLFSIAQANAVSGVTVYQMMVALFRANNRAFIQGNMHHLRAGSTLKMPGRDALTALSDREARRIFQQHAAEFARYRGRGIPAEVVGVSTTEAATHGEVSQDTESVSAAAPVAETRPPSGDRLRLSVAPDANRSVPGSVASEGLASVAANGPALAGAGGSGGQTDTASGGLFAASGTIASDAIISGRGPAALADDHAGVGNGAEARGAGAPSTHPDDAVAEQRSIEETKERIIELEDNVRHLNEALQKQGHVAAETALEGLRAVGEAIQELISSIDSDEAQEAGGADEAAAASSDTTPGADSSRKNAAATTAGSSDSGVSNRSGTVPPSSASAALAGNGGQSGEGASAPGVAGDSAGRVRSAGSPGTEGSVGTASSARGGGSAVSPAVAPLPRTGGDSVRSAEADRVAATERDTSWLRENVLAVIGALIAFLIAVLVWVLRRSSAAKDEPFESDSPITDTMVREKLRDIDLDLQGKPPAEGR